MVRWSLTGVPRLQNGERTVSLTSCAGRCPYIKHEVVFCHMQKLTQNLRSKYKIQHYKSPKAKYGGKSLWHWTTQWFLEYDIKRTDKEW